MTIRLGPVGRPSRAGRALPLTLALGLLCAVAGCTSSPPNSTITVGAAASLTDVFSDIAEAFTAAHPDTTVTFTFAGSSTIAEQVRQGAPIDAFASAGTAPMSPLVGEDLVNGVVNFATNSLQIATPKNNPARIQSLADLPNATYVVCQLEVPCGAAASELFARNSVPLAPSSYESDVRAVLTKVIADEVDAGLVYVTDVLSAGGVVTGVDIPAEDNITTTYQAAVVRDTGASEAATLFVEFLTTDEAQAILAAAGFGAP